MKKITTVVGAALYASLVAFSPAFAAHTGEAAGITREGGHHHHPHTGKGLRSHIVTEGGHHERSHRRQPTKGHWGAHHHHGIHLEGSH